MPGSVTGVTRDVTALSRVTSRVSHATYTTPHHTAPCFPVPDALVKVRSTLAESPLIPSPNRLVGMRARLGRRSSDAHETPGRADR